MNRCSLSPAVDFPSGSGGEPGCTPWSPGRPASGSPQRGNGCTLPRCWYRRRSARWTLSVEGSESKRVRNGGNHVSRRSRALERGPQFKSCERFTLPLYFLFQLTLSTSKQSVTCTWTMGELRCCCWLYGKFISKCSIYSPPFRTWRFTNVSVTLNISNIFTVSPVTQFLHQWCSN